jgi:hypothetical protein
MYIETINLRTDPIPQSSERNVIHWIGFKNAGLCIVTSEKHITTEGYHSHSVTTVGVRG